MALRIFYDLHHHLECLYRVFTLCCLPGKHDSIGSVIYRICHVGYLCTCRTRIPDHGIEHLCRRDNRFEVIITFLDNLFLNIWNFLCRNFHTHITSCHHDAVRTPDNFINIADSLRIFDLGNDRNVRCITFS